MNNIKIPESDLKKEYEAGDLFKDPDCDQIYILAQIALKTFAAISLQDGNRWNEGPSVDQAVERLDFYRRNATITISCP